MTPQIYNFTPGQSKLLISIPHAGTFMPKSVSNRLTAVGRQAVDTDWHVDRLYAFARDLDVTIITATHARSVVDLNRAPSGCALYPGQAETGICPTQTFDGAALYAGAPPDAAETGQRVAAYWQPYHDRLQSEITRLVALHGSVRLLDAHSIRGEIPRLFEGALPDLNFGTNNGASADPALTDAVVASAAGQGFSHVVNGRFRGGYITRHYGQPAHGVHAIQLELAQRCYCNEKSPEHFDAARAAKLIGVLRRVVAALLTS